ncbi:MAG: biopolymer transporter ExbD [Planctomycetota bacterium]|nr:biopolymer transporter ExbD [Planctomycetota bacterium]
MAGGGESEDNPVNINVVPMVDVIFCLCVFFMCSFKFKQLEGRFQSWLPRDLGNNVAPTEDPKEMRVAIYWDDEKAEVVRQYGQRYIKSTDELEALIRGSNDDFKKTGKMDVPVIIDGDSRIPWEEVMTIVNIAKRLSIEKIQFALGAGAPTTR